MKHSDLRALGDLQENSAKLVLSMEKLKLLDSVTEILQNSFATIQESSSIFDTVLEEHPGIKNSFQ